MKKFKTLIATILTLAMTISLFTFPIPALGADEAEDYVLFTAKRRADVTNIFSKLTADSKYIQNSKFSAKWVPADVASLTMKVPKDLTIYNEFKATIYSTAATTFYAYFITDNPDSDGMDYYGKLVKLTEGWNDISVPFSKMETSRKPSWGSITSFAINATGFGQEAPDPKTTLYIDHMALSKNLDLDDVTAPTPEPSREPLPEGVVGTARYMENDFAPEQKIPTGSSYDNKIERRDENGNYYMHVEKTNSSQVHTDFTIKNASRYVVMQADFASKNVPGGTFISVRSNTANTIMLSFSKEGKLTAGGQEVGSLDLKKGTYTNIALAFDFGEGIYSVYIDGKLKAKDIKISGNPYHASMIYRIFLGAGDYMGAYMDVDNIKIFDGKTPADFENTESLEVTQEKLFESLRGSKSGIIDYGDKVVARVDAQKAVAMNVHSGYIHANGQRTMPDTPAYIKNGRTLLPVRAVSEALGCEVGWDDATKTVTINGKAKIVIGSTQMTLPNGSAYTLDVPAEITNGRTFIPLRALCEQILGKKVFWDDRGLIVLSDRNMTFTDSEVVSLNNYMLYVRPSGNELLAKYQQSSLYGVHPRVILNQADFDKMVYDYNTNPIKKSWGDEIIKGAEEYIKTPHEKRVVSAEGQILTTSRKVKSRVFVLSIAYKLTGKYEYIQYLKDELVNAANYENWNHEAHFLDPAEMIFAFAIAYDWNYDLFTAEERKFLEEAMYNQCLKWGHKALYGQCDYPHFFVTATSNWNPVCNGSLAMASIALFDVYPEICADIIEKNIKSIESVLTEFFPDGAWYEGISYWDYLMEFFSYTLSTLDKVYGTDFNLTKAAGFSTTANYYLTSDGMTGENNYHDTGSPSHKTSAYLFYLANKLNQPGIAQINLYKLRKYGGEDYMRFSSTTVDYNKWPPIIGFMMFYDTAIPAATSINYPLDSYFRVTELVNMRSTWTSDEGIFASIHSGENNVNHAHLDNGTFVVDIGGQRFAGDIGAEDYAAEGYFTSSVKRYHYYRARPEGHNCYVINPDETYGQELNAGDEFIAFETKARGTYAITSQKNSYAPYASDAKRGIMLADDRRSVIIRDEIRGMKKDENTVMWFMQLPGVEAEIIDNKTVVLTKNGVKVNLQVLSDAKVQEITITEPVVMETSVKMKKELENKDWKRLAIKLTTGKDLNITVKMAQYCDPVGDTPIVDTPLADWSIPDGAIPSLPEIPTVPTLQDIRIGGQSAVKNFDAKATYHMAVLPYGTTAVPQVEAVCGPDATAEVTLPATLPGEATITLTSTVDARLKNTYTLFLRAANDIEIETSGEQEGNGGDKCMDGDLTTRWAVEGESYGIFTFATPKAMSSVWIATWKAAERQLKFDIEVSTDGVNFTQVFSGMTQAKEDILEEVKIPAGTYKAVKLVMHGTTTGAWNSVLEIDFK